MARILSGRAPDILECLSNLSTDEVFTPPSVANQILDLLPSHVWTDSSLRFLDPCCKSGVFLREAAKRLLVGLESEISDVEERLQHIFRNMLFGVGLTTLTGLISRRTLYCSKDVTTDESVASFDVGQQPDGHIRFVRTDHQFKAGRCTQCGGSSELERGELLENHAYEFIHVDPWSIWGKDMQFDVIIGNPPYQLKDAGDSTGASPIYHKFVEQALELRPRFMSFIIPSRWFAGGKGLDEFRERMLGDRSISHLVDYHEAKDCFPGVEIKGGVCYFLWERDHSGDCLFSSVEGGVRSRPVERDLRATDVLIRFNEAEAILEKVRTKGDPSFMGRVSAQKPFGFRTNFTDYSAQQSSGDIEIFGNKAQGWIARDRVLVGKQWIDKYKVLLSRAYNGGEAFPHQITNRPKLAGVGSCCTETYLVIYPTDDKHIARNVERYMKTRFFRFMVMLRKISQDNPRDRFQFVPDLDMTKEWTDDNLFDRYELSAEDRAFIEAKIKEMV